MCIFFFILFLLLSSSFAHRPTCGTEKLIEHQKQIKSGIVSRSIVQSALTSCKVESYYNQIDTMITNHFVIYYTLEGVHATTLSYLDSLAFYLEKAWNLHTTTLGMKSPKGMNHSYHYNQENTTGLYPVEVLDIDHIRDTDYLMGGPCHGCFGLTYPGDAEDPEASILMIDNDFKYTPEYNQQKVWITDSKGNECSYTVASEELYNQSQTPYSYSDYPEKAIQVTSFHELYHAAQIRYMSFIDYPSFWFEASAVGVEEIGAKEVNDYWNYLYDLFDYPGTPLTNLNQDYGAGALYLYLYQQNGASFDASIWDAYSKKKESPFYEILSSKWINQEINPDSAFHDFAKKIFFTGSRSKYKTPENLIYEDAPHWPKMKIHQASSTRNISLSPLAFDYLSIKDYVPSLDYFKGKASLFFWNEGDKEVSIEPLVNAEDLSLWQASISKSDSAILVLSRFSDDSPSIEPMVAKPLRAYPTPWQGNSSLCFSPLPDKRSFIEIRNRIGNLVVRIPTNSMTHCLEVDFIKSKMVPGLYHFRIGSHGKTTPLLLIY